MTVEGRHLGPPSARGGPTGELAPISTSRLNLDALEALDSEGILSGVIDVIRDRGAFLRAMRPGVDLGDRPLSRGTSRHMLRHWDNLSEWGVLGLADAPKVVLPAFTVEKKSGLLRLVCDGRKLNRLMRDPPPMLLPSIHEVVRRFLAAEFVVQADGKSWFYQFPLGDGVRDFFGVNLAGERGPFRRTSLRVMCMGWSWAPCIAQRASRVLLPLEDGLSWVDNWFVVGDSREDAAVRYARFLGKAESVGAELNEGAEFGTPQSRFIALGLEFDLESSPKRFRSDPDWVSKFLASAAVAAVRENRATSREFYKVFGGMIWFLFSTQRRLCYFRASLAFLRRSAAKLVAEPEQWDRPLDIPPSVLADLSLISADLGQNVWVEAGASGPSVTAWSDASDTEWAALLELDPEPIVQGCFDEPLAHHIYVKELFAALQATRLAAATRPGCALGLQVDNTAAVAAINKGHSKNYLANDLLCALFDTADGAGISVSAQWVPTHAQRADEFTRGTVASPCPVPLAPLPARYAAVAAISR